MSTRKVDRRQLQDDQAAIRKAAAFLESATPLTISMALAQLGATTAHRSGIESIIESLWAKAKSQDKTAYDRGLRVTRGLIEYWENEISAKNRQLMHEDFVLLVELAGFYVKAWAERREREAKSAG